MNRSLRLLLVVAGLAAVGCDDSQGLRTQPWSLGTEVPRFAVRSADFKTSVASYGLLDANGDPLADAWIHSGSTWPGLTATLSGDNVLPTVSDQGVLTILDRFQTDVVTRVDFATGAVLGQARTQTESSHAAWSSNPQDMVFVSPTSAWISRYEPNVDPAATADSLGNDLVELNPQTMTLTGQRIDMSPGNVTVSVTTMSGTMDVVAYARPSRMVQVPGRLVVGIDRLSASFDAAGPGAVAIVDLGAKSVTVHGIPDLQNCGDLQPVPGASNRVLARCVGYYGDLAPKSGFVVLEVGSDGSVNEVARYETNAHPSEDSIVDAALALSSRYVLAVHLGGWTDTSPPDALYVLDLSNGTRTKIADALHPQDFFVQMAYDPTSGLVLVPDHTQGIRRYHWDAAGSTLSAVDVRAFGRLHLPVVAISLLP